MKRFPYLGEAAILFEITVSAEYIPASSFARVWIAQRKACADAIIQGIGIVKHLRQAAGDEMLAYLNWTGLHGKAGELVIR